jgi:hypothetical protein
MSELMRDAFGRGRPACPRVACARSPPGSAASCSPRRRRSALGCATVRAVGRRAARKCLMHERAVG